MVTSAVSLAVPASADPSAPDAATGAREAIVTRDSVGNVAVKVPDARGNWVTVNSASSVGLLLGGGGTEACQEAVCTPPGGGTPYIPPAPPPCEPPSCNPPTPYTPPAPPPCEPPFCNPPAPAGQCRDYFHAYIIYIPFGPELVRWNFKENYCYNGVNVTSISSTDDLRVFSDAIMKGGNNGKVIGPSPASVVRVLYNQQTFAYCPVTPTSNCFRNFSPVIDHYFLASGQILNVSTL
jgi:hypothetical protein